jgi:glycerol-3-phosphate dehydrogenase (NAD(P)+)
MEYSMSDDKYKDIAIVGNGGMGTVSAMLLLEKGFAVRMWGYDEDELLQIKRDNENKKFLSGYKLPKSLIYQPDDSKIMAGADLIISAVPCQYIRSIWERLKNHVPSAVPIISVAKGIENETLLRPTEILADVLGVENLYGVLSGPTIADELARKLPAIACAAADDEEFAKSIQHVFNCSWLRVYTNTDVIGVELAGAMKNVIAIAAGIIDGIKAGDNAKAALLARGLAEIARLGVAMGADKNTFSGLTGLGDLVTTCISPSGRNRSFGERIGKGLKLEQAVEATESVVEGVATCKSVIQLAKRYNVEMPITQAVYDMLFEDKPVTEAIEDLMNRQLKAEY